MAIIDSVSYSVCEDCLHAVAYGVEPEDDDQHVINLVEGMKRELDGRKGHFVTGVEPSRNDPYGSGYNEFSYRACELCRSPLGGSRHGVSLLLED